MNYRWIDTFEALTAVIEDLQHENRLAVDTEFVRTNTYYPKPGLIQVANQQSIYLIDPLAFTTDQLAELGKILVHSDKQIIMHSAGEDLEIFLRMWGALPARLFDTQIAASLVGYDRQMGLQRLLKQSLDTDLAKEETRSDWLQRPLTDKQKLYAAADVEFLFELADLLIQKLTSEQRLTWMEQECFQLLDKYQNKTPDDELYLNFGAAWRFTPEQQAALKNFVEWREKTARDDDTPKTFIIKDASIYGLIERRPNAKKHLTELGLQGQQVRKYGDQILAQLEESFKQGQPCKPIPKPLTKRQQGLYKTLKMEVARRSEALNVPSDLLASKSQLSNYLIKREEGALQNDSPFIGGWREVELQPFLDAIELKNVDDTKENGGND